MTNVSIFCRFNGSRPAVIPAEALFLIAVTIWLGQDTAGRTTWYRLSLLTVRVPTLTLGFILPSLPFGRAIPAKGRLRGTEATDSPKVGGA